MDFLEDLLDSLEGFTHFSRISKESFKKCIDFLKDLMDVRQDVIGFIRDFVDFIKDFVVKDCVYLGVHIYIYIYITKKT